MKDNKYSRRKFFNFLAGLIMGGTGVIFILPVIRYLLPEKNKRKANLFQNTEGEAVPAKVLEKKDFIVGFSDEGPTAIMKRKDGIYAISLVCTHLGCIVKWIPSKNEFLCPCHAGIFDANGVVISGPPPEPLPRYKVNITPDGFIALKKI